ncbi:MAG: TolC family protein, partial [Lentimicrobium sp.]|nr:TolC family protein [Lentimicrobium sp.]
MKIQTLILTLLLFITAATIQAQPKAYSLSDCINRAVDYNLQVRQALLATDTRQVNKEQTSASRFPTLDASARQNFIWNDYQNQDGSYDFTGTNSSTFSVNSSVNLFNGYRTTNSIKQAGLAYDVSKLDVEAMRESISLQVLDNYLQVLYAGELLTNSKNQLNTTREQLAFAQERLELKIISKADYLQVKAQEASEKLTLANAEKQLQLSRVNLMQLLEIPVNDSFAIVIPDLSEAERKVLTVDADRIFETALGYRPEIQSASIQKQIAGYDIEIAKSGFLPSLSMNAGVSTNYNSLAESLKYASQLDHNMASSVGLTLSVPIFQQKQVRSQVSLAKINLASAEISEQNTRNQLRKAIETAWVDVLSAEKEFDASNEQFAANSESF